MTVGVVCIDASFVMGLVTRESSEPIYIQLWNQWQESDYAVVAPALIYYEVSNALHRLALARQLLPERASQALEVALSLNVTLYNDAQLHQRALTLARELLLPATYDAHYLALAERLEAEFWTADRRLVNLVQATLPWVHLVA